MAQRTADARVELRDAAQALAAAMLPVQGEIRAHEALLASHARARAMMEEMVAVWNTRTDRWQASEYDTPVITAIENTLQAVATVGSSLEDHMELLGGLLAKSEELARQLQEELCVKQGGLNVDNTAIQFFDNETYGNEVDSYMPRDELEHETWVLHYRSLLEEVEELMATITVECKAADELRAASADTVSERTFALIQELSTRHAEWKRLHEEQEAKLAKLRSEIKVLHDLRPQVEVQLHEVMRKRSLAEQRLDERNRRPADERKSDIGEEALLAELSTLEDLKGELEEHLSKMAEAKERLQAEVALVLEELEHSQSARNIDVACLRMTLRGSGLKLDTIDVLCRSAVLSSVSCDQWSSLVSDRLFGGTMPTPLRGPRSEECNESPKAWIDDLNELPRTATCINSGTPARSDADPLKTAVIRQTK